MKHVRDPKVAEAARDVERAKDSLNMTVSAIRDRLDPRVLLTEAKDDAIDKTSRLVDAASTQVRAQVDDKPWLPAAGAVVVGIALGLLTRGKVHVAPPVDTPREYRPIDTATGQTRPLDDDAFPDDLPADDYATFAAELN